MTQQQATTIDQNVPYDTRELMYPRRGRIWGIFRIARKKPLGAFSVVILLCLVILALGADYLAPYDPLAIDPAIRLQGPSLAHPMGTDQLGRDVFSRVIYGARPSLYTGFLVVGAGTFFGLIVGVTSGYFRGMYDLLSQRIVDALMVIPGLILAMALLSLFSSGIHIGPLDLPLVWGTIPLMVVIVLTMLYIPTSSRIARAATLATVNSAYIEAARATGATHSRIILRHIIPNIWAPMIVIASLQLGGVILTEAILSFLGLGLRPPAPSWGAMLQGDGRRFMELAPWLALAPGAAITLVVLSFNLAGDALRDLLDPRLRQ